MQSIVKQTDRGLWLMSHNDFRFGSSDYPVITAGYLTGEQCVSGFIFASCKVFRGDDGRDYLVFKDLSARVR